MSLSGTISYTNKYGVINKTDIYGQTNSVLVYGTVSFPPVVISAVVPSGYDADLLTYISGLSTPLSDAQKTRLNTFIVNVKAGMGITNLSDAFDIMYVFANETEEAALRNLVKRNYDASLVLTPAFTAFEGYQTSGTNYVKSLINLSIDASRYVQDSASYGFYSRKTRVASATKNNGASGGASLLVYPLRTAAAGRVFVNSAITTGANITTADTYGMTSAIRDASMSVYGYKNKIKGTTITTQVSNGVPNTAFVGFGTGLTGQYDDLQFAFGYAGRALTGPDVSCLVDNFNKYLLPTYFTFPSVIMDGSTLGWYIADASSTSMTFSVDTSVSQWNDLLCSGRDLVQTTGVRQPQWTPNGVLFDGVDDSLTAAFTYNNPQYVYLVAKQITWTSGDYIFDGGTAASMTFSQYNTTPGVLIRGCWATTEMPLDTFVVVRALINGGANRLIINNTTPITSANAGAAAGGFTIGGRVSAGVNSNIQVKEIILRNSVDNATDEAAIYNYLATKYSIT